MKYWLFRATAAAVRWVPRRAAYAIARFLAFGYYLFKQAENKIVAGNLLRLAAFRGQPLDAAAARCRARDVYASFAKTIVDYYYFATRGEALAAIMEVENIESLARARALGCGTVVVTAHLGCVENGGSTIVRHGYVFNVVALTQADPRMDELFQRQRTDRGMQVIPMGRATRECLRAMQRNEIVALVGDRDFTQHRDTTSFFGAPARLPTGPVRLALAFNAPVVTGFCVRLPGDRFKLFFHDPIFVDKARDTAGALARQIAANLERAIGDHADQWHIFHDPWDVERDLALARRYTQRG
jgi:KDO2-lipid IV(A) lauroyltransferase